MYKLLVAGSRSFFDLRYATEKIDLFTRNHIPKGIPFGVVSGKALGADEVGEEYAESRGCSVEYFEPDWVTHPKRAGYIRNEEMGDYVDGGVIFWNGWSKGTKHMIEYMKKLNKPLMVVYYNADRVEYFNVGDVSMGKMRYRYGFIVEGTHDETRIRSTLGWNEEFPIVILKGNGLSKHIENLIRQTNEICDNLFIFVDPDEAGNMVAKKINDKFDLTRMHLDPSQCNTLSVNGHKRMKIGIEHATQEYLMSVIISNFKEKEIDYTKGSRYITE